MAKGDKLPVVMGREKAVPGGVATLGADGILEESQRPTVPGKNLLINSDFRKPVNRNGKAEYTNEGTYAIDRWLLPGGSALSIHDGYISLTASLDQILDYLPYGQYTASILTAAGLLTATATVATVDSSATIEVYVDLPTVGSLIFVPNNGWRLRIHPGPGYQNLIAAILEAGDHQTHFRQNEDGEWEIIDPIDYDTQYLLCSQYSPITGEWVGSQHSNQNLLHNWYFVGGGSQLGGGKFPINQHGQTEYANNQYGFDRWMAVKGQATAVGGITIESDHIHVSADYVSTQPIENYQKMQGKTYTASVLTKDNKLISGAKTIALNNQDIFAATPDMQVYMTSGGWFQVYCFTAQDLLAAKLELGPVQTLAHKEGDAWVLNDPPPDYALELMKCQRYQVIPAPQAFYRVRSVTVDTNVLYFHLPISGELRAKPAIVNSDRIQVASIGGSAIPGFSFEVDGYGPGWISVIATKNAHGLADAWLLIMNDFRYGTPVIFDANL